jgi:hypothetical protein
MITTLMMEAVQASETLVNLYQSTSCYNPEDGHLHTAVRTSNHTSLLCLGPFLHQCNEVIVLLLVILALLMLSGVIIAQLCFNLGLCSLLHNNDLRSCRMPAPEEMYETDMVKLIRHSSLTLLQSQHY